MKKPYFVLKSFYEQHALDEIFSAIESRCLDSGMFPLNRGKVFPALFRRILQAEKILKVEKLVVKLSDYVGFPIRSTKHSEFQINTIGGWHTDLGDHLGGYLPPTFSIEENGETKIFRIAIFSRETIQKKKCTQFKVNGVICIPSMNYGDVLIFSPEQEHRATPGNFIARVFYAVAIRLKVPLITKIFLWLESALRSLENRKAIFFTTGSIGDITDFYEKKNLIREDQQIEKFNNHDATLSKK